MYFQQIRVLGRIFAAALIHVSTGVMLLAPAARNITVCIRRTYRGQALAGKEQLGRCTAGQSEYYRIYLNSDK
jgi:hypothetical protein